MSKIVSLLAVRHSRAAVESGGAQGIEDNSSGVPSDDDSQFHSARQQVFRSLLLIDLAVQQARLLPKQMLDPAQRKALEAQIAAIERLLQLAREKAMEI